MGGIFGYSHTAGGYDSGQAEFVRVPFADVGPTVIPPDMDVEDAVLLTDAFPTGYQAAEMGGITGGDTVVVFGAGPVGLFAARSAWLLGAGRVIVVDHVEYRLDFAHCEVLNFKDVRDMALHLKRMTVSERNGPVVAEATPPDARKGQGPREAVPGWSAGLDPAHRPAVPRERTPPRLPHLHWTRPEDQPAQGARVFHSIERPGLTPVYGTTVPPRGLSGLLRGAAFRYSESDLRHWLVLMAADRIDVGEGLLDDLAHGRVPHLWREMGLAAAWKHNRSGLLARAAVAGAGLGLLVWWMRRDRR